MYSLFGFIHIYCLFLELCYSVYLLVSVLLVWLFCLCYFVWIVGCWWLLDTDFLCAFVMVVLRGFKCFGSAGWHVFAGVGGCWHLRVVYCDSAWLWFIWLVAWFVWLVVFVVY